METKLMSNTNCLKGMRCPACQSYGPFRIVSAATILMSDDGSEEIEHIEWKDHAWCRCEECKREGTVVEFTENYEPKPLRLYEVVAREAGTSGHGRVTLVVAATNQADAIWKAQAHLVTCHVNPLGIADNSVPEGVRIIKGRIQVGEKVS